MFVVDDLSSGNRAVPGRTDATTSVGVSVLFETIVFDIFGKGQELFSPAIAIGGGFGDVGAILLIIVQRHFIRRMALIKAQKKGMSRESRLDGRPEEQKERVRLGWRAVLAEFRGEIAMGGGMDTFRMCVDSADGGPDT